MVKTTTKDVVANLSRSFTEAHSRYLRADLDRTFKTKTLLPLRKALHDYERIEKQIYSGHPLAHESLLLQLRSVSLIAEGFYWIGAYDEARRELERYSDVEDLLRSTAEKDLKAILTKLSGLAVMKEARSLLLKLASEKGLEETKRRIVQEVIRIGLNIAVVFYYSKHDYDNASSLLEICGELALTVSQADARPYGLLAQIDYFTACTWRQVNRLIASDNKLRDVLEHYLNRTNERFDQFVQTKQDVQSREEFYPSSRKSEYRALSEPRSCENNIGRDEGRYQPFICANALGNHLARDLSHRERSDRCLQRDKRNRIRFRRNGPPQASLEKHLRASVHPVLFGAFMDAERR
jgi:hypothetical protein